MSHQLLENKVYRIPVGKVRQSLTECFRSALNFWQSGNYVAEKLGFHIAVGLIILGIEELGKYVLLDEAIANIEDPKETVEIPVGLFKSHRIKLKKGQSLFKNWGIDLEQAGIPLTNQTRESLWYVAWDPEKQEFKRDLGALATGAFPKMDALQEFMRRGLVKMQELERASMV